MHQYLESNIKYFWTIFELFLLKYSFFYSSAYLDLCHGFLNKCPKFLQARLFLRKTSGALSHWLSCSHTSAGCEGIMISFPLPTLTPATITEGAGVSVWTIITLKRSDHLVMKTLLNRLLYQNTFKFPEVQRSGGKLNCKVSKTITASDVLLVCILDTNPVCNHEAFTMLSWICIGHWTKCF